MKLLYISNVSNGVGSFSIASVLAAKRVGLAYHMAANFSSASAEKIRADEEKYGIKLHQIDFKRNPLDFRNVKAYRQLLKLIETEQFDYIHCNTPIGGFVGRIAGHKCRVKRIIYQVHGFHFYSGAPLHNWLLYYPIERGLAHFTDALITINKEDFERAKRFQLRNRGNRYYVHGVGIEPSLYEPGDFKRERKREELGLDKHDIMAISVGDLIERKNYKTSIEAIAQAKNEKIHLFICGQGPCKKRLEKIVEDLAIEKQVHFLGYRNDIMELLWASDIFLLTSYQEGLPRSLSEAMAAGLPCLVSNIRGNNDLLIHEEGGFGYDSNNVEGFAEGFIKLSNDPQLRLEMGQKNKERIHEFGLESVINSIEKIYRKEFIEI